MWKKILIVGGICLAVTVSDLAKALATIKVQQIDTLPPNVITEPYSLFPVTEPKSINTVQDEVYHMQNLLPILKNANWNMNYVNQGVNLGGHGDARGYATKPNTAYIFQSKNPSEGTAHELSHLARWNYITDDDLNNYVKLRDDGKQHTSFQDTPEELFANDLTGLFGSDMARGSIYKPTYGLPGIKEKAWLGERLGYTLPYPEKLEYFKVYPEKGQEEIIRAGGVWREKTLKKDKKGADNAHLWAEAIRKVLREETIKNASLR